ncbi:serine/threonine-protein kinase [Nocardia sp. NPDC048505]|uniref:serine/threonine-protein kinase n=1 Tax=unclassified Nocardia TaxID=2637762 RepID=UPI0033CF367F
MSLQPGARFAGFTIERTLGVGGMGTVYLGQHPRLRRPVALKVLANAFVADQKTRAAFDREATVAAGLEHPNIVSVYDRSDRDDPALWLAMRYIDGGDAAALLDAHPGGLEPARAVRLLSDAAHALDYAHRQGVLHRDVKPANLLIENSPRHGERAVLTDFGIARTLDDTVTLSGIAATFAYAAPERFTEAAADHRADIYSLGCTLFQLLTGEPPFPRKDQAAVIGAHLNTAPPAPRDRRPGLPAELDEVIATALAKSPRDRYASCTDLAEAAAAALPRPAPPDGAAGSPDELEDAGAVYFSSAPPDQSLVPTVVRWTPTPGADHPGPPLDAEGGPGWSSAATGNAGRAETESAHRADVGAAGDLPADAHASPPGRADTHTALRTSRGRRMAMVSGLLLAGVGVIVGAAFSMREDTAPESSPTTTTVAPQPNTATTLPPTTTPVPAPQPVDTLPPAESHESIAPAPRTQQYVPPPVQQPASPNTGNAPVPQTRVHQWPG